MGLVYRGADQINKIFRVSSQKPMTAQHHCTHVKKEAKKGGLKALLFILDA